MLAMQVVFQDNEKKNVLPGPMINADGHAGNVLSAGLHHNRH